MRIKPLVYLCLLLMTPLAPIQTLAQTQRPEIKTAPGAARSDSFDFRVLATNKTSTMEKEMNAAADAGYRFAYVMGGETSFGGSEAVVVMAKKAENTPAKGRYQYKLLATNKTSTMQKEMSAAGDAGFNYCGQTVYNSSFGGQEVVILMEQDREGTNARYDFLLLATKRTSTMQKELNDAGQEGYEIVGMTVSKTAFAGTELVVIMRRPKKQ